MLNFNKMMRFFIPVILIIFVLSACTKDEQVFIPDNPHITIQELKYVIASKSIEQKLSNDKSYTLRSDYSSIIEVDKGVFFQQNEATNLSYDFQYIELKTYQDFILQNVNHHSDDYGLVNTLYSFYISAESEGEELNIDESRHLTVKIPLSKVNNEVLLGKGEYVEGELRWQYFNTALGNRVKYTEWDSVNEDGVPIKEVGYEVLVDQPGWYSIVSAAENNGDTYSLCLNFDAQYNSQNTLSFVLLEKSNYLTKLDMSNDNSSFCNLKLPLSTEHDYVKIVSISQFNNDEYYYFQSTLEELNQSNVLDVNPQSINLEQLKENLNAL